MLDSLPAVGFKAHAIGVCENGRPVLHLPVFYTEYALHAAVTGRVRAILCALERVVPVLGRMRILGVGFTDGEWGHIGFDPAVPAPTMRQVWRLAMEAFDALARSSGANLKTFVDFNREGGYSLVPEILNRYAAVPGQCCGVLPIRFETLDDYLSRLSKVTRKDLRRKLKGRDALRVVRTQDPAGFEDRIFALYRGLVDRSATHFGDMQAAFFSRVTREVPGAFYTLYFKGEELIAFNLLVRHGTALVDKYFCMSDAGREHSLYFLSWMENIAYCLEHKLAWYHAGPAAPDLKRRLGAEFLRSATLFRLVNPVAHALLVPLSRLVDMGSGRAPVQLGSHWQDAVSASPPAADTAGPYRFLEAMP